MAKFNERATKFCEGKGVHQYIWHLAPTNTVRHVYL